MNDKEILNQENKPLPPNVEVTEESKTVIFVKQFFIYMGFGLLLAVPFALLSHSLPNNTDFHNIMLKISNGLSMGGLLIMCWAAWGLAYNLGSLAIASYSIKKTWQVVTNRGKAELGDKKLGTYDEYLASRKKKTDLLPRFLGGAVPAVISLIIYFIWLA